MEQLLVKLKSNNNSERGQAEAIFNEKLANDVRSTLNELLQIVLVSNDVAMRQFAAVLFRGQLVKKVNGEAWWSGFDQNQKNDVHKMLLEKLVQCNMLALGRLLAQIIGQIAKLSYSQNMTDEWPTLLSDLANMCNVTDNVTVPVLAISTLKELMVYCTYKIEVGDTPMKVAQLLNSIMTSSVHISIRLEAVKAIASLLSLLEEDEAVQFSSVLGATLQVFETCISDEELALQWFEAMIDILNSQPKMIMASNQHEGLVTGMIRVAADANQPEDIRKQALEVCSTLNVVLPLIFKKNQLLTSEFLKVAILFMLDPEDDMDEHAIGAEDESLCDRGERSLYFAVECLGEEATLPILFPMIDELLSHREDWKKQRAGYVTIMMAGHNGGKMMYDSLAPVLKRILDCITSDREHTNVRKVALDALSTLLVVYGDVAELLEEHDGEEDIYYDPNEIDKKNIQHLFAQEIVQALDSVLVPPESMDAGIWGVKARGAAALSNFCSGINSGEGLELFVNESHVKILEKVLVLLQNARRISQEQHHNHIGQDIDTPELLGSLITAVGSMASAIGEQFGMFYDAFMPIAIELYVHQDQLTSQDRQRGKEHATWVEKQVTLRGQAMESISDIGQAVGTEKFKKDAEPLMGIVLTYMDKLWNKGDSDRNRQVAEFASSICTSMGVELMNEQILGRIIPPFIEWAKKPVHEVLDEEEFVRLQQEAEANNDDEDEDGSDGKMYHFTEEGQILCLNTYRIKDKECVFRIMAELVDEIGLALMPWAGYISTIMVEELMSEVSSPDMELCAAFTVGKLIKAISVFLQKQGGNNTSPEQRQFAQRAYNEALEACIHGLRTSFEEAEQEDAERLEEEELGKEADDDDDQGAVVIVTIAEQIPTILRAAFESGGLTDSDVDKMYSPNYNKAALQPLFATPVEFVPKLIEEICQCMTLSCNRKRGKAWWKDTHNNDVMDALSEAVGLLIKIHGDVCLEAFERFALPLGNSLLKAKQGKKGKGVTASLKAVGLFFYDDVIEYGGPRANLLVPAGVPHMIENAKSQNVFLRQAAVYGLGVCAHHGGDKFTPMVASTVDTLIRVIEHPNSRKGNNTNATDNAICALLKCILYRNAVDAIPKFLSYLPCNSDTLESRVMYYLLCRALVANHPQFVAHAARIKEIFLIAYKDESGFSTKTNTFDEESAILSSETRAWIQTNIIGN